ncbi:hypothetical protein TEA_019735 [Camellia sinensis var. sinensis]|uniref:2-oxoadipate dioxygenase/decarboxylase n=1 Tax=Camellia sinensis var. sinensis TaxID=542762 RepID=A0A4S4E1R9_CAMSN|nr:hypothetical protein TEA_019735 [Camellia sinensis var. sinensis]
MQETRPSLYVHIYQASMALISLLEKYHAMALDFSIYHAVSSSVFGSDHIFVASSAFSDAPTIEIIRKYTEISGRGNKHAALASALGSLTWEKPLYSEFQQLARESEYAAWTLVNGYAVNHVTISTHHLKSQLGNIKSLNQFIEESGFKLSSEGGVLKGL